MTDGYVGNDMEIVGEIKSHPNARVFSFGIGSSVNRFLLDKMAEEGRGEVEYVGLNDDGSAAARRFHERVRNPLLTDIRIDWNGLPVADVYPKRIPDLFSAKPVVVTGRYTGAGKGVIKLNGMMSGWQYTREIAVELPETDNSHDVLATLWASTRIEDLMSQDWSGIQQGTAKPEVKETITQLGLEYRLMTQFTSFVAVEEMIVTDGGQPRRVEVPIDMPEGVSREGVFGEEDERMSVSSGVVAKSLRVGSGNGTGYGVGGATVNRRAMRDAKAGKSKARSSKGANASGQAMIVNAPVASEARADVADGRDTDRKETPKEKKERELLSKQDPAIAALIARVANKRAQPGADEAKFVRDGKAEIQIWLDDKSPQVIAELKKLGFEVVLDPQSAKMIIGRISVDKLASLLEVKAVKYISPQMTSN
jgi:Ca-activated chloride channel family protein